MVKENNNVLFIIIFHCFTVRVSNQLLLGLGELLHDPFLYTFSCQSFLDLTGTHGALDQFLGQFLIEGDMGVYGIAVWSFFSSGISVILILMCGITVSFSPAVCGFSSFWLTVSGKRRSFTVLRYCSFGRSCLM